VIITSRLRERLRRGAAHPSLAWVRESDEQFSTAPSPRPPVPWSRAAAREGLLVAAGVPFLLPLLLVVTADLAWASGTVLMVLFTGRLSRAQRSRMRHLGGVAVPEPAPVSPPGTRWPARCLAWATTESTYRQLGYHLLVGPALALLGALALIGCGAGALLSTVIGWGWAMPRGTLVSGGGQSAIVLLLTLIGAALLFAAPWLLVRIARVDRRAARALLGPSRARELQQRVADLAESRAGVVDAADAERRRIERDLHDGAQQRLVSLAMNLGLARKTLKDVSPEAMQVIVDAHEEAQAAIAELRDLVRGLHPVVLEDRGLDAALSGIAARAPLPVRLDVQLERRMAPTVEAVAYFVVSEALANVAKHAQASRVDLSVRQLGATLHITITDDGIGGADPSRGTGLVGLRKRAASVDGTLTITSPVGGPTVITVELPCEPS
jgi:signal transduction histidine kinase